jgi:hypothetical protein
MIKDRIVFDIDPKPYAQFWAKTLVRPVANLGQIWGKE